MNTEKESKTKDRFSGLRISDGKIYFSRQLERKFYFALTMIMLAAGIGYRLMG